MKEYIIKVHDGVLKGDIKKALEKQYIGVYSIIDITSMKTKKFERKGEKK